MKRIEKEYEEKICVHCDYYKDRFNIDMCEIKVFYCRRICCKCSNYKGMLKKTEITK